MPFYGCRFVIARFVIARFVVARFVVSVLLLPIRAGMGACPYDFDNAVLWLPFYGRPFYGRPFYGRPFCGRPFCGFPFCGHRFVIVHWSRYRDLFLR